MGTPTQTYVDPSIAGDSGAGSVGDPYGDLQYALNQVTRDSTNGDQFNIKAGTDEVLGAALDLSTYGTPAGNAPLVFRGYTSAANDGGIGGVSGDGSYSIIDSSTLDYISFIACHLHNSGAAKILELDDYCNILDCEIDNTSGGGVKLGNYGRIANNHIHNIGGVGAVGGSCFFAFNYFKNGTNDFTSALQLAAEAQAIGNIFSLDGASNGIEATSLRWICNGNSILSAAGTGTGIVLSGSDAWQGVLLNNCVEGFSGAGGKGINFASNTYPLALYGHNAVYNCTTKYSGLGDVILNLGDNEELTATPFAKSGADTFANRFTYFAPADTGNVQGGAYPSGCRLDKGAVQHADPAGGGGGGRRPRGLYLGV